jgi:hypothetical protein
MKQEKTFEHSSQEYYRPLAAFFKIERISNIILIIIISIKKALSDLGKRF